MSHDRQFVSLLAQTLWLVDQGKVTPFADTFEMWMQSISEPVSQTRRPAKPKPPRTVRAAKINTRGTPEEDPDLANAQP